VAIVETLDGGGHKWFHVRVGAFATTDQAAARQDDVATMLGFDGDVVGGDAPAAKAAAAGG
jgi:hypothetical protein